MRRRYRRRTATYYGASGHSLFGGTGWLFADLLLALALTFLLATTVSITPPPKPPPPVAQPTDPVVHPTAGPGSHPKQPPPLELDPVHITFSISDPAGLAAGSTSAVAAVRATILQKTRGIKARSAGIVLLFGGNGSQYPTWDQVDQGVQNVLKRISATGSVFHQQTRYVHFLNISSPSQFSMDVYLFSGSR